MHFKTRFQSKNVSLFQTIEVCDYLWG